jgi:hypothetical protein
MAEPTLTFDDILRDINPEALEKDKTEEVTIDNMVIEGEEPKEIEVEKPKTPTEEVAVEEKVEKPKSDTSYSRVAKTFLDKGKWQDVLIEDADGNQVELSKIEDLDEETFLQIQEDQESETRKKYEEKYLSVENVDDRRKQVADIVLKGGDLEEIFGSKKNVESYLDPYKGIDLDDEQVQSNIYYNHLINKGYSDKAARFELQEKKKELILDTEVNKIVEETNKKAKEYVTLKQKELEDQKTSSLEQEKEYKKNLSKSLKERYKQESTVKKYVDLATKRTEDGEFAIDSLYNEIMQNPEEAIDLIAFISDKENFLKEYKSKAKTEVTKDALRSVKILKPKDKIPQKQDKEEGFDIPMAE